MPPKDGQNLSFEEITDIAEQRDAAEAAELRRKQEEALRETENEIAEYKANVGRLEKQMNMPLNEMRYSVRRLRTLPRRRPC